MLYDIISIEKMNEVVQEDVVLNKPRVLKRSEYEDEKVKEITDFISLLYAEKMGSA